MGCRGDVGGVFEGGVRAGAPLEDGRRGRVGVRTYIQEAGRRGGARILPQGVCDMKLFTIGGGGYVLALLQHTVTFCACLVMVVPCTY